MRIIPLLSLILLAACAPVAPVSTPQPAAESAQLAPRNPDEAAEAAACPGKHGRLERVGKAQTLRCIVTYSDAGKACTDGAQCQAGRCTGPDELEGSTATVAGTCAATNDPFGCGVIIRDGKAATICVD